MKHFQCLATLFRCTVRRDTGKKKCINKQSNFVLTITLRCILETRIKQIMRYILRIRLCIPQLLYVRLNWILECNEWVRSE